MSDRELRRAFIQAEIKVLRRSWPASFQQAFPGVIMLNEIDRRGLYELLGEKEAFEKAGEPNFNYLSDLSFEGMLFVLPSLAEHFLFSGQDADSCNVLDQLVNMEPDPAFLRTNNWAKEGIRVLASVLWFLVDSWERGEFLSEDAARFQALGRS